MSKKTLMHKCKGDKTAVERSEKRLGYMPQSSHTNFVHPNEQETRTKIILLEDEREMEVF